MLTIENLEKLPSNLFKSHVEYYALWFYLHKQNRQYTSFRKAMRSRQKNLQLKNDITSYGYLGCRGNPSRYRSTHVNNVNTTALWMKPFDSSYGKRKFKFELTQKGENKALNVLSRINKFLYLLTFDLT